MSGATLDVDRLNDVLKGTEFAGKLHHFTSIDSTQNLALADAQAGVQSGQVYIADEQTAGRGRGGNTWHSKPDDGLYLSVLVRPDMPASGSLLISLATGLAARAAIRDVADLSTDLRWPNDLVTKEAGSRKLGGILTEAAIAPDGRLRHAVIGIGINLNQTAMPELIADIATSLRIQTGQRVSREVLVAALLRHLASDLLQVANEAPRVLVRFASASSWVTGKPVQVAEDGGYTGVTAGLTPTGLLQVRCEDGTVRTVRHGGVRER